VTGRLLPDGFASHGHTMAAVVNVNLAPGVATAESCVHLDATEGLVGNTPFINWDPVAAAAGAPARVAAPHYQLLRTFGARLSLSPAAADRAAALNVSAWRIRFTAAAWSRILTELKASGYAATSVGTLRKSDQLLASLTLQTPARLQLAAADWMPAEAFTIPVGAGAIPAARRALLLPLQYLNLVSVPMLIKPGLCPFQRVADLAGYLGACSTHASRYDPVGVPQASAVTLSAACGDATLADGVRAQRVATTLDRLQLPQVLRSTSLEERDLALELDDGIVFHASASSARNVLEQRVLHLAPRCATHAALRPTPRSKGPHHALAPYRSTHADSDAPQPQRSHAACSHVLQTALRRPCRA
jgi:hypothetical protein